MADKTYGFGILISAVGIAAAACLVVGWGAGVYLHREPTLYVGDLNNDRQEDLVVKNNRGDEFVFLGKGKGKYEGLGNFNILMIRELHPSISDEVDRIDWEKAVEKK